MPFWERKSEEEKRQEEERERREEEEGQLQEASLQSLERGSIPIQAQRRLDEFARQRDFFTSDLSVNEFLLARQSGFEILSQVMGSSVYHVGWQRMPVYSYSRELEVVSGAMNHARQLALGRMAEEAQRVGANAVIGVHVQRANYDWAGNLLEFSTIGTAVRLKGSPPSDRPGLTNLSGQDFWKLHRAGYWPVGVVAASTVFYVVASWRTQMANNWWRQGNQELTDFTQGLYTARHLAMQQLHSQCKHFGAAGIVGMKIEQEEEEYEVNLGNDRERKDMIFTFHALGTAIADYSDKVRPQTPYSAVSLRT